jgi:hypothetical protein
VTLRAFVAAAYALLVRFYMALPEKNLLEAIDLTNETFGIKAVENISSETRNEQSLKELERIMGV